MPTTLGNLCSVGPCYFMCGSDDYGAFFGCEGWFSRQKCVRFGRGNTYTVPYVAVFVVAHEQLEMVGLLVSAADVHDEHILGHIWEFMATVFFLVCRCLCYCSLIRVHWLIC